MIRMRKETDEGKARAGGQGLLEFALILPILLLLLLGIIEFGYILTTYTVMFNAAREGSRQGTVGPLDPAAVEGRTREMLRFVEAGGPTINICCDAGPGTDSFYCNPAIRSTWQCVKPTRSGLPPITTTNGARVGDRVVVSMTYDLPTITPIIGGLWPSLPVRTQSARTIASLGEPGDPPPVSGPGGPGTPYVAIYKATDTPEVPTGADVIFHIIVENIGSVELTEVKVSDPQAPNCNRDIGGLGPGQTFDYYCTANAVVSSFTNQATVTGKSAQDAALVAEAEAFASVQVLPPNTAALVIDKSPSVQNVIIGSDAVFDIMVRNTGDLDLQNVVVTDPRGYDCERVIGDLVALAEVSYSCVVTNVTGNFVNTANVYGENIDSGKTASASDGAAVNAVLYLAPIAIREPLLAGQTVVSGTAEVGETVFIRDLMDVATGGSQTVVTGTFSFDVLPLIAGHVIAVDGYGQVDYALVEGDLAPITITLPLCHGGTSIAGFAQAGRKVTLNIPDTGYQDSVFATVSGGFSFQLFGLPLQAGQTVEVTGYSMTSGPVVVEPCTTGAYVTLRPQCGFQGPTSIRVEGWNWPTGGDIAQYGIHWDVYGDRVGTVLSPTARFTFDLVKDVVLGDHEIIISTERADGSPAVGALVEAPFIVPCPAPNLVVDSLELATTAPYTTYQWLDFGVVVRNNGSVPVSGLFWADLFVGEPPAAPATGFGWGALSGVAVNGSQRVTITRYFASTGTYDVWALADSSAQVLEMFEDDNTRAMTSTFVITQAGSGSVFSGTERIVGQTWVNVTGLPVPQGRSKVWCVNEATAEIVLITWADMGGQYMLDGIPPGVYTVLGEVWIGGNRFSGTRTNVVVTAGQTASALVVMYPVN